MMEGRGEVMCLRVKMCVCVFYWSGGVCVCFIGGRGEVQKQIK